MSGILTHLYGDDFYEQEAKMYEQQWMVLKDQYSEIANILFKEEGDAFFGDTSRSHDEIKDKAWELRNYFDNY